MPALPDFYHHFNHRKLTISSLQALHNASCSPPVLNGRPSPRPPRLSRTALPPRHPLHHQLRRVSHHLSSLESLPRTSVPVQDSFLLLFPTTQRFIHSPFSRSVGLCHQLPRYLATSRARLGPVPLLARKVPHPQVYRMASDTRTPTDGQPLPYLSGGVWGRQEI